ncbi:MAG: bifunctional nuclease family protein [Bacteroidota bacterium]|nr:bifunctional nuclease family protein [Bacteroidota bacterium]MDP4230053.1 bifunctional nuclease family protein [Bacteroidota bacterium]
MDKVQVEILGISTSPASNGAYALVLKESGGARRIPIIIGGFEAQAIALEMEGITPPRPLTHDLVKNVLEALNTRVTEACIAELKDGIFFATITLSDDQEIDSRPSDAIAIAVRYAAPIFVTEAVMKEAGFVPEDDDNLEEGEEIDEEGEMSTPPLPKEPPRKLTKIEQLEADLDQAIKSEDYEKAAKIRDDIKKMTAGSSVN